MVSTRLKNISQIGNLPQLGVKIKNNLNHHLAGIYQVFSGEPAVRFQGVNSTPSTAPNPSSMDRVQGTYGAGTNMPFSVTRRFIPLVLFLRGVNLTGVVACYERGIVAWVIKILEQHLKTNQNYH